jgi:hypothetical protein
VLPAGSARAHRLEAEYRILPGGKIQIESWFDLTGASPKEGRVQVFRADGQLLTEGRLDGDGQFLFSFSDVGRLRVVVSAPGGHRKELEIPAAALKRAQAAGESSSSAQTAEDGISSVPAAAADRSPRVSARDVLAGIALVFALAAFTLSVRNARRLRELGRGERTGREQA